MAADLGARVGDAVCFGHTHKPWHRRVNEIHFINTGSVGRPKDGDPRACYAIIACTVSLSVEFVRVDYAIEKTVAATNAAGLPEELGEQLRTGGQQTTS